MAERSWQFNDGETIAHAHLTEGGQITGGRERQGLYDISSLQNYPLGFPLRFRDGRSFRYAHFISAVDQGKLAALDATYGQVLTTDNAFKNAAGTGADQAAGVTTVYYTSSNVATAHSTDTLSGGYLHITDEETGTSQGYTYRIKKQTWLAANRLKLDLYDPIKESIGSEDSGAITGCPYKNLAIYNAGTDDVIAGVVCGVATAGSYGWVQTYGVATVLLDGTATRGGIVTGSDGVDGACQPMAGGAAEAASNYNQLIAEPVIGYFLAVVPTTEYCPVFLQICY